MFYCPGTELLLSLIAATTSVGFFSASAEGGRGRREESCTLWF